MRAALRGNPVLVDERRVFGPAAARAAGCGGHRILAARLGARTVLVT
jgi:hypothetical protein